MKKFLLNITLILSLGTLIFFNINKKSLPAVVFQSDFGLKNNAVASMYGVAKEVSGDLDLYDLTHDIPAYDIWTASLTLMGVLEYWPTNTVFVSVVDPGVGTKRPSVIAKTKTGHYIVTPDNGTLTFVDEKYGIEEVREIEESRHRRANSEKSYTFHGRDVYAYSAAKLAAKKTSFQNIGAKLDTFCTLKYTPAERIEANTFEGSINVIDEPYGNIWSNIDRELFLGDCINIGDIVDVSIWHNNKIVYSAKMPYVETFGKVENNSPLLYINSLYQVSLALNMNDFARTFNIGYGENWKIRVSKTI
ncbi:MAG: SAM hydrolase/SAM-dependent halogenase family protein [Brevinemataceae bacterium]